MYPDLIHAETAVGLIEISSYTFFLWIATGVMGIGLYRWSGRYVSEVRKRILVCLGILVIGVIGARLMHMITNSSSYRQYPAQIFSVDPSGLSIFGAMVSVGIVVWAYHWRKRISLEKNADMVVPYFGASITLSRIGCFLNGCCFGVVTGVPWAVRFPLFSDSHIYQVMHGQTNVLVSRSVHPTQLYEIAGVLFGLYIARRVQNKKRCAQGTGIAAFIGIYMLTRSVVHLFRVFPDSFAASAPVFPILYISISIVCMGYIYLINRATRAE